jgi:hypothetical protein
MYKVEIANSVDTSKECAVQIWFLTVILLELRKKYGMFNFHSQHNFCGDE